MYYGVRWTGTNVFLLLKVAGLLRVHLRFTIQINAVSTRFISTGKTFNVPEIEKKKDTADFTDGVYFYSLSRRGGVYVTIAIIGPIILT